MQLLIKENLKKKMVPLTIRLLGLSMGPALLIGCGASMGSSNTWKETRVAKVADADAAYDSNDFLGASTQYEAILEKDPENDAVRMKLAYTYNALARLRILDLGAGFASLDQSKIGKGTEGLKPILGIVGLNSDELTKLEADLKLDNTEFKTNGSFATLKISDFVKNSERTKYARKSWEVLCRFISSDGLDLIAKKGSELRATYKIDDPKGCNGGAAKSKISTATSLALTLALLSETATLLQSVVLDPDGNVRLLAKVTTAMSGFQNVKLKLGDEDAPEGMQLAEYMALAETTPPTFDALTTLLTTADTALSLLNGLAKDLASEPFNMVFQNLSAIASLITEAPGVPRDVTLSIRKSIARFQDISAKARAYAKDVQSITGGMTKEREKIADGLKTATQNIDNARRAFNKVPGQKFSDKIAANAGSKAALTSMCGNFDQAIANFGLPVSIKKPVACGELN